jgi:hypothetical protein
MPSKNKIFQPDDRYFQQALSDPYLPDFHFLFKDASQLSPEELVKLEISYFRSVIMTMAFRHRTNLIFQYFEVIFEGADDKEHILATIHYILGIAERSPKEMMEQVDELEFTTKPNVMSTLEQLLEMGRQEGLSIGVQKEKVFNLLKTAVRFPDLNEVELSDFTGLPFETVQAFSAKANTGDPKLLLDYLQKELLAEVPLQEEEKEQLEDLVASLAC